MKRSLALAKAVRLTTYEPQHRLRYVIETYLRSTFLYKAMLLPDLTRLKETGDREDKILLSTLLECSEKSLTGAKLARLRVLYQINPVARKVEKDARRFINKMRMLAEEKGQQNTNRNTEKVTKHARRALWVLENSNARSTVARVFTRQKGEEDIKKEVMNEWNWAAPGGGLIRTKLPVIKWKTSPPPFRGEQLRGDHIRKLIKWYLEAFPIPAKGKTPPKGITSSISRTMEKGSRWPKDEESRVMRLVEQMAEFCIPDQAPAGERQ